MTSGAGVRGPTAPRTLTSARIVLALGEAVAFIAGTVCAGRPSTRPSSDRRGSESPGSRGPQ
jgi:hypothetical protein